MRTGVARGLTTSLLLAVAFVLAVAGSARADEDEDDDKAASQGSIMIDAVEVIPSRLGLARVRALVSAIDLNGKRIRLAGDTTATSKAKRALTVKVGSAKPSAALTGVFESSEVELALVVLVPVTGEFDGSLPTIREHLKTDLFEPVQKALGARAQLAVIGYAEGTVGSKRLSNATAALGALENLEIESTPPALLPAVQRAVTMVKNAVKKPRKPGSLVRGAVLIVSDGLGVSSEEREAITKLAQRARKDLVRIHSIAYSPIGRKRPLFHLGELSRQSSGTFRWVRTEGGWTDQLTRLQDELLRQTVLTFFAPADELADKKLVVEVPVGATTLASEAVKVPDPECAGEPCDGYCSKGVCVLPARADGGGLMRWLLLGGGGVLGLGLVIGGIALVRRRRVSTPMPAMPGMPGMPGFPGFPGSVAGAQVGAPAMPGVAAAPAAPAAIAPGTPIFIVVNGPQAGQRLALKQNFSIGKAPGSDLDLSHDGYASTNHAIVTFDGQAWTLVDRGSTNGTFVNDQRVQFVRLEPGTTVRLGSTEVRFWTA